MLHKADFKGAWIKRESLGVNTTGEKCWLAALTLGRHICGICSFSCYGPSGEMFLLVPCSLGCLLCELNNVTE